MSIEQQAFYFACQAGDLTIVRPLTNQVNVNWANPAFFGWTALHVACSNRNREVVEFLLSLPQINVNKGSTHENTPLLIACASGSDEIVRMFAGDGRVDFNKENRDGMTPLWSACFKGNEGAAKILLASQRRIDTTKRTKEGTGDWNNTTAAEIVREGPPQLAALVEEYEKHPKEVAQRLRKELHWPTPASAVFAQIIFLSDGFLALSDEPSRAGRFFAIVERLHLDLQYLLANRSQGLTENHMPDADRELAFRCLARSLFQN